ncbi:MAG: Gfo/Idh/MocA family oxidoreductase [Planctomycetota bacterium]
MRAAIIGCGVIGPVHAAALAQDRRVELAWACDLDRERARSFGAAKFTTVVAEVLADPSVDLVCVCTPHPSHAELGRAVLAAGKHLIVEKPLGVTPEQVGALAAADNGSSVACAIFQHRFAPLNRRLAELCASGTFGKITEANLHFRCLRDAAYYRSANWRGTWDGEGGGVLINQAIHGIDLMLSFAGDLHSVESATVGRRLPYLEAEDHCQATLRLTNGAVARIDAANDHSVSWLMHISVRGTVGHFTVDASDRLLAINHPNAALVAELQALSQISFAPIPSAKPCYGPLHGLQIHDAIEAIATGRQPYVRVATATMSSLAVLGIYHAAATGKPASVPFTTYQQPRAQTALHSQESRS